MEAGFGCISWASITLRVPWHHNSLIIPVARCRCFYKIQSSFIRSYGEEPPAVKMHYLLITGILMLAVLFAGCSDEAIPPPGEQPAADAVQPGQVLALVGPVTGDGLAHGTIDTITFTVGLAPGEKPVDMEKISIVYADTIKTETLLPVAGFHAEPAQGEWSIVTVNNEIGGGNNRLEDKELFVIKINPRAYLPPNRMVMIAVRTPTGSPLMIRRIAPPEILATGNILTPP